MFQRWKKESGDAAGDDDKNDPTLVDIPAFENQACFVRTRGAGARESWPEVLAWRTTDGERSFTLRRDKTCCYVSTDFWKIRRKTSFEVCDGDDVWLTCVLTPGDGAWTLECKIAEAAEAKGAQPRWEMNIEVSLVGKFQDCPCFLQETAVTTRRISRGKGLSALKAIDEEGVCQEAADQNAAGKAEGLEVPDFSERFIETYKSLGGTGTLSEGESGDITWFNAGLRIGVGVGLGICLGAGLGAGILVRSYQVTANTLKKRFSSL